MLKNAFKVTEHKLQHSSFCLVMTTKKEKFQRPDNWTVNERFLKHSAR